MSDGDEWLTVEEIAAELKVSMDTVRRLIQDGAISASQVGRQWRVRRSSLNAYLERGKE